MQSLSLTIIAETFILSRHLIISHPAPAVLKILATRLLHSRGSRLMKIEQPMHYHRDEREKEK